ncbi:MAG: 30S ribosomal protein S13 [Candidatus Thermoplasmatota archaeon]|jgi:small subunit ribosomal protein S13|nr:30S ribosomal protein S13 [Candidatus Thermoplasmatota archaeon]MCL5790425.1 30S ribosomal protein S13 [Candidatus Thermoplasmatota archaeon]
MPEQEKKEDFQYIVRIANKDLNGERNVVLALSDLKGIGIRFSETIVKKLQIDKQKQLGELSEDQIQEIREYVEAQEYEDLPPWMLNNRKDPLTGKDTNLVSNDLEIQIQDNINVLKKMRSYKGIRHETKHKVRGQRTRSNGRKGLSVGVQRKKE